MPQIPEALNSTPELTRELGCSLLPVGPSLATKSLHKVVPASALQFHGHICHISCSQPPRLSCCFTGHSSAQGRHSPTPARTTDSDQVPSPEGKPHSLFFYSYIFHLFLLSLFFDNLWDCLSLTPHLLKYISENCPHEDGSLSRNLMQTAQLLAG